MACATAATRRGLGFFSVALKAYETVLSSNDVPAGAKSVFQQQHDAILQAKNWLSMNKNK
jgi:hypothetical protein